jgi:beta-glucanase (GH16 family)
MNKLYSVFFCITLLLAWSSCGNDDSSPTFSADFEYSLINDNLVRFENKSSGEYFSAMWDFGNGQVEETTDKNRIYEILYPEAGTYKVTLKLLDFIGNIKSAEKIVSIASTTFSVSFSAEISPDHPNIVKLTNQTQGQFDSFKWVFRGQEIENAMSYEAYFPFSGNYSIDLVVMKDGASYTARKQVIILADDPNYVDRLSLTWAEEFDGNTLNTEAWTYETGASGWGNNELQNYTAGNNADVSDGFLTITAKKVNNNTSVGSYTSSRIISRNKADFQYGRIEIRAKLPSGRGIWPAIWMLGGNFTTTGWPACGEIDIMEYVGYEPNTVHHTIHTTSGFGGSGNGRSVGLVTCEEEFHNYGIIWTKNKIEFYIDTPDNTTHTYAPSNKTLENWPFDQTAFFILNIAVGGNWGGAQGIDNAIFPQTMEIDYVRVYQETF